MGQAQGTLGTQSLEWPWGPAPPLGDPYLLVTRGQVNFPRVRCLPGDYRVSMLQP